MIVALAGHVDHGKTSLVKALTGVDTDRLEEERRRGLTIDLGFAYTDIGGRRIGFVDVPGHHRFVHNMVAGVASRQFALLVVAADDGPMPQTREHLDILSLMGLKRGVVALTKSDRVSEARLDEVRAETSALLTGSFLARAEHVALSTVSGHGIDGIRSVLAAAAAETNGSAAAERNAAPANECFRLAVDRAFSIRGTGLIVTGTVYSGSVSAGDELTVTPRGDRVRVRSIRVQDRDAPAAQPGDRCAMNIAGIEPHLVSRGTWLVAPETFFPTSRIVMRVEVLRGFPRPVRHWTPVHVHHATDHTTGRLVLLDSGPIAPGSSARVEVELDAPLHPKRGDRIVIRDHAGSCTLGGGEVIDIDPAKTGRRKAERLARLDLQAASTPNESFDALLRHTDTGVDMEAFRLNWNLSRQALDSLLTAHRTTTIEETGRRWVLATERVEGLAERVTERLGAYHKAAPYSPGLRADRLRQIVPSTVRLLDAAVDALHRNGRLRRSNGYWHIATHRAKLAPDDEASLRRLVALLETNQPPSIGDAARQLGIDLATLHAFVDRMNAFGLVIRVSDTRCFLPATVERLERVAGELTARNPDGFTAGEFRDAAGIGRNLAIDLLEHFDRIGITRRHGERRRTLASGRH